MSKKTPDRASSHTTSPYWSQPISKLFTEAGSSVEGLDSDTALSRRSQAHSKFSSPLRQDMVLLLGQFKSPLQLILIFAVVLSMGLGEYTNSLIIAGIVLLSGLLGFWQERKATRALQELQALVTVTATVLRDGKPVEIPASDVVPGDIVLLHAGDIIPGDCIIIESKDLHVNESTLTGESFPAEKESCLLPGDTSLSGRKNCVLQGASVVSGTAKVMVIMSGDNTEYGKISATLEKHQSLTAFEEGIKKFGFMIMRITLFLSLLILLINIYLGKPVADSILFALALAVGMAPELLPAIVTITLAAGATRMAGKKVIVKKLSSIQNLGAVNIFCSDKTGTLTEGIIKVQGTVDGLGIDNPLVKTYAFLNATFETGFTNPLDQAIRDITGVKIDGYDKVDEVPYDFIRKRLSIAVAFEDRHLLITKGAANNILDVCQTARFATGSTVELEEVREKILDTQRNYSAQGFRTIGVCYKDVTGDPVITKEDETGMTFLGFIVLSDSLKAGVADVIRELREEGVALKVITGDNLLVAAFMSSKIGLRADNILTGGDLKLISDEALPVRIMDVDVFAETEPNQKERLVHAFRKSGNVVAYIGDGINDVSALHAADVGITVDTAVDVAKETADIVLLEKDLKVLQEGIREGRKTFVNSLKYIFITTSASFGNMFSMAGTSLFLPFLPLLPKQILLLNLLSDLPAMTISSDNVDEELLLKPRKWNTKMIQKFMIVFGIESSLFDFMTFGVLLFFFQSNMTYFQTGWFIESIFTEILILLVIRTQRPFLKSRPGKYLLYAVLVVGVIGLMLPYLPFSSMFGFDALPWPLMTGMIGIALLYTVVAEFTKRYFFKKIQY